MLFRTRSKSRLMILLYLSLGILVFPLYFIYKPPSALISYFQYRWKDVLWHIATTKKIVALTIDDTPSQYTDEILQVLKANDAQATFFVIGAQVSPGQGEQTLRDIIRNGSELGNHAMHDEPSRSLSDEVLTSQIREVEAQVDTAYRALDKEPPARYFRPGSGFFSTGMRELVISLGYRMVLGNIYPHDPQIHSAKLNGRHILSMLKPGSIIICHDRRAWTAPMLREVLPEIRKRGFEIVTVTGLLEATAQAT